MTVIGIATIEQTKEVRGVSAIARGEGVETVRGKHPIFRAVSDDDHVLTQGASDVALAVGIPITTIVKTMITPHRATGTAPAKGMTIGTFQDATAVTAITMMARDATAAILKLAGQEALAEDAVAIEGQGNSQSYQITQLPLIDINRSRSPQLTEDERDRRTVFVQQLAARLRTKELITFFEKVGPVKEAQIVKDRVSGRSKGYVISS